MINDIAEIKNVYDHLGDELSKDIYSYRLMYSITGDLHWIRKFAVWPDGKRMDDFCHFLNKNLHKEHAIYGAAYLGIVLREHFPTYHWDFFVDDFPEGKEKEGLPLLSLDELRDKHIGALVIIASEGHFKEMKGKLVSAGFCEENVINFADVLEDIYERQYFDLEILPHAEEEVFVDCGCFDGKTSRLFTRWCNNKYAHIYAFEPDKENYIKCENELVDLSDKITLFNYGVWNKNETLQFDARARSNSLVSETGSSQIDAKRLDDVLGDKKITFIKMDLEGSEYCALEGGAHIIRIQRPKLAISVYHKPEDIVEIPKLILSYNPEYKFYLRHYSVGKDETVIYAI